MNDAVSVLSDFMNDMAESLGDNHEDVIAFRHSISQVENLVRAAQGVMTQTDYETPHHTRLRDALAPFKDTP